MIIMTLIFIYFPVGYRTFCAPEAKQERILAKVKDKIKTPFFKMKDEQTSLLFNFLP